MGDLTEKDLPKYLRKIIKDLKPEKYPNIYLLRKPSRSKFRVFWPPPPVIEFLHAKYAYLSPRAGCNLRWKGIHYPTFYNAIYGALLDDDRDHDGWHRELAMGGAYSQLIMEQIKGRYPIRSDWYEVADEIALSLLLQRFSGEEDARKLILTTGHSPIVFHARSKVWRYWGYFRGSGLNRYGEMIVQVRNHLMEVYPEFALEYEQRLHRCLNSQTMRRVPYRDYYNGVIDPSTFTRSRRRDDAESFSRQSKKQYKFEGDARPTPRTFKPRQSQAS